MTYKLFIDDERNPSDVTWIRYWEFPHCYDEYWVVCRTLNEVKESLAMFGMPNFISFDHDLGQNEPTGYDIVKYIVNELMEENLKLPDGFNFVVHSKNPVGKKNIELYFEQYLKLHGVSQ